MEGAAALWAVVLLCSTTVRATIYHQTMPEQTQKAVASSNCDALWSEEGARSLCELIAALKAQASDLPQIPANETRCKYKQEGGHRLHRYALPPSRHMEEVMVAYLAMHRRCTSHEFSNISEMHNTGKGTPRCRYVISGQPYYGLGNRVISIASSFLYAILSQRVFLITFPGWKNVFCEPFQKSVITSDVNIDAGVSSEKFLKAGCPFAKANETCRTKVVRMKLNHAAVQSELEFLISPDAFGRFRDVPFIKVMRSNQYFATGFFENPALSPLLNILFPDRNPFHVLSRYLFSPSDKIWAQIRRYADRLATEDRRVGVQIREYNKAKPYTEGYDSHIIRCLKHKLGLCSSNGSVNGSVSVYVATLERRHVERLNETAKDVADVTGRQVTLYTQELMDTVELHDVQHQQRALVDLWMLSLSDVLLTTFESTFGYVAQSFGGIVPYFIQSSNEVCKSGISSEPCFHVPPAVKGALVHVQYCPDRPHGWQLLPP